MTLELFDGMVRLTQLVEDDKHGIRMTVSVPTQIEGEDEPRVADFNLVFDRQHFLHLLQRAGDFFQMTAPAEEAEAEGGVQDLPLGPEGACPSCESSQGILAKGVGRKCQSCEYAWRVA